MKELKNIEIVANITIICLVLDLDPISFEAIPSNMAISTEPDLHGLAIAGEGSGKRCADIVTIAIVVETTRIRATVLLPECSVGHLHIIIDTAAVVFCVETCKC